MPLLRPKVIAGRFHSECRGTPCCLLDNVTNLVRFKSSILVEDEPAPSVANVPEVAGRDLDLGVTELVAEHVPCAAGCHAEQQEDAEADEHAH